MLVRKHRGKFAAITAVVLTLVIGIIATTWQSIRATRAETAATASERKAVQSEQEALTALEQTTKERDAKNAALTQKTVALDAEHAARDLAERQFIERLLRPVGFSDGAAPDVSELRCFVDWAAIEDSGLKLRVLEIAFENPDTSLRVARRADRVAQACVTLSPSLRTKAIDFCSAQQRRTDVDPRIRIAAVWLAMESGHQI